MASSSLVGGTCRATHWNNRFIEESKFCSVLICISERGFSIRMFSFITSSSPSSIIRFQDTSSFISLISEFSFGAGVCTIQGMRESASATILSLPFKIWIVNLKGCNRITHFTTRLLVCRLEENKPHKARWSVRRVNSLPSRNTLKASQALTTAKSSRS